MLLLTGRTRSPSTTSVAGTGIGAAISGALKKDHGIRFVYAETTGEVVMKRGR